MKIMVVDNEAFNLDFVQVVQKTVVQKLTPDYKMETKPAVRIYTESQQGFFDYVFDSEKERDKKSDDIVDEMEKEKK